MMIRLLDEAVSIGDKGALLFTMEEEPLLRRGARLKDARGNVHTVSRVEAQEDLLTLLIEAAESSYFERLFRDIRIDATAFELLPE